MFIQHQNPPGIIAKSLKADMTYGDLNIPELTLYKITISDTYLCKQIMEQVILGIHSSCFTIPKLKEMKNSTLTTNTLYFNIFISAHKNCKAFISHGGMLSVQEAIHFGVPLLGFPFFGDQPMNLAFVDAKGIGIKMDFDKITYESLYQALYEILNNPK